MWKWVDKYGWMPLVAVILFASHLVLKNYSNMADQSNHWDIIALDTRGKVIPKTPSHGRLKNLRKATVEDANNLLAEAKVFYYRLAGPFLQVKAWLSRTGNDWVCLFRGARGRRPRVL